MSRLRGFLADLKRRKVYQVGAGYLACAFVIWQAAEILVPALGLPEWGLTVTVLTTLIGFPVALGLSWAFDITSAGIQRTPDAPADHVEGRPVHRRLILGGVVGVISAPLTLIFVWWAFRPSPTQARVAPGADVIAVIPFRAVGQEIDYLSEGMVDLLSSNLGGIGGIRTVDPRRVLTVWGAVEGRSDPLSEALSTARDAEAGSALWGSIVQAGPMVRFNVELRRVDGELIGEAQADGRLEDLLHLVDSLSIRVLRAAWRSSEPLPSTDVAAITSGSLQAVGAYLRGMKFYRDGQWDSAVVAFGNAIREDSTFAMAHYHLASSYGWIAGMGTPGYRVAIASAVRFANRLSPKDRSVVLAHELWARNELAALDTMRAYVARYPSDPIGWYLLGDWQIHSRPVLGLGAEDYLAPFDRALDLDPSFNPALVHPTEFALQTRDEELYRSYVDRLPAEMPQARIFRQVGDLFWGEDVIRQAAQDSLSRSQNLAGVVLTMPSMPREARLNAWGKADSVLGSIPSGSSSRSTAAVVRWAANLAVGKLRTADSIARALGSAPLTSSLLRLQPVLAGYSSDPGLDETLREQEGQVVAFLRAQLSLAGGDSPRARQLLSTGTPTEDFTNQGFEIRIGEIYRATRGWALLVEGDTTAGITTLRQGLDAYGPILQGPMSGTGILRLHLARAMASRAESRTEGINRLLYGFLDDIELLPAAYHAAAKALDDAGANERAADLYSRFVELWHDADPELQPRVQAARDAIARLTASS